MSARPAVVLTLALAAIAGAPRATRACPATPEGMAPCHKYDHMMEALQLAMPALLGLETAQRWPTSPTRARVMRLVTRARWVTPPDRPTPVNSYELVRFIDGANVPDLVPADAAHNVLIRTLRQVHGRWQLTIDGARYWIGACRVDHVASTCLTRA